MHRALPHWEVALGHMHHGDVRTSLKRALLLVGDNPESEELVSSLRLFRNPPVLLVEVDRRVFRRQRIHRARRRIGDRVDIVNVERKHEVDSRTASHRLPLSARALVRVPQVFVHLDGARVGLLRVRNEHLAGDHCGK